MRRKYFYRRGNYLRALGTMFIFLQSSFIYDDIISEYLGIVCKDVQNAFYWFWKTVKWIFQIEGKERMRKKKVERIKNNIVLSIKYARLQEEIRDTEVKKHLAEKKKFIGSKEKEIDKSDQFIQGAIAVIDKIEQNNNRNTYSLVVNNQVDEQLKLLSNSKISS